MYPTWPTPPYTITLSPQVIDLTSINIERVKNGFVLTLNGERYIAPTLADIPALLKKMWKIEDAPAETS